MADPTEGSATPVSISRRGFVGGATAGMLSFGFGPLLRLLPRSTVAAAFAAQPQLRFFDEHQAAVVTEATARLIPGPQDDPAETTGGAREARVVTFIDLFLSAFDEDPPRIYAGGPFSDRQGGSRNDMATFVPLAPWEETMWRERVAELGRVYRTGIADLDAAAGGDFTTITPEEMDAILTADTPSGFRLMLFTHTVEGVYSVPEYGGNAELVGWTATEYPGDVAPLGWPPAEVTESDGPDPVPEDFELPFPADIVGDVEGSEVVVEAEPASTGPTGAVAEPAVFLAAAMPELARWRTRPPGARRSGGTA